MDARALEEFIARTRGVTRRDELDRATSEVLGAFAMASIDSLLLKGPALSRLLYRPGESRSYLDVDLLVRPDHLDAARAVLSGLGYSRIGDQFGIDDVAGVQHAETWALRTSTSGVWIDLHWRLPGCDASDAEIWDGLEADSTVVRLPGREARVPGVAGLAFHVALHAAQHGPQDVKALADLSRGVERWRRDQWRSAAILAGRLGASKAFAAGLALDPGGSALAAELSLERDAGLEWQILNRDARPRGTFHLGALNEVSTWRGRADVVRRSLLPRQEWIRWELTWASRSRAHLALGYGIHLARAPIWALRAAAYLWKVRRARGRQGGL